MTDCKENKILEINQDGNVTIFTNHSKYKLIISILPIKPKIKHRDFVLIPKESFRIDENALDLTKLSFRLVDD